MGRQAFDFVDAFAAPTPKINQIARWSGSVCVQVTGLAPDKASVIQGRVEDVAKAVGLKITPAGCKPNIQIVFSGEPQKVIDDVFAKNEVLLGYYHRSDRNLRVVTQPIQAWYATATAGGAGPNAGMAFSAASSDVGSTGVQGGQTLNAVLDSPDSHPPTGCGDSHFSACLRSVFENVLVVVDLKKVKQNVGVISDYVTVLALAQPRSLEGCKALPSITDLFASCPGRAAPDQLTPADAAYLTALYQIDPEAKKAVQQGDLANRMTKMLAANGG